MIIQNIKRQNLMNKYILTFVVCVFIRNVSIGQTYPHEYAEYKFIKYEENKLILSKESNFNVLSAKSTPLPLIRSAINLIFLVEVGTFLSFAIASIIYSFY